MLAMKSTDLASLSSEGATVLLGVLLADMTGTSLSLYGVAGIASSCYYPAAFVNEVLRCVLGCVPWSAVQCGGVHVSRAGLNLSFS